MVCLGLYTIGTGNAAPIQTPTAETAIADYHTQNAPIETVEADTNPIHKRLAKHARLASRAKVKIRSAAVTLPATTFTSVHNFSIDAQLPLEIIRKGLHRPYYYQFVFRQALF